MVWLDNNSIAQGQFCNFQILEYGNFLQSDQAKMNIPCDAGSKYLQESTIKRLDPVHIEE